MTRRTMPHWAAKRDKNEKPIIQALLGVGASVVQVSSKGQPDLLVGYAGEDWKLEVKMPGEQLTDDQVNWWATWSGRRPVIVTNPEEALRAIGAIE